jgi:hypothetical protein
MRASEIRICYHVACMNGDYWKRIFNDQVLAFRNVRIYFCILGNEDDVAYIANVCRFRNIEPRIVFKSNDFSNFEHQMLLYIDQMSRKEDGVTLYFHTKSVSDPENRFRKRWARYMNIEFLYQWREHLKKLLTSGNNCLGPLFLCDENLTYSTGRSVQYFAGNCWMAKNSYLRTLQSYEELMKGQDRHSAEYWIGDGEISPYLIDQTAPLSVKSLKGKINKYKWRSYFSDALQKIPFFPSEWRDQFFYSKYLKKSGL